MNCYVTIDAADPEIAAIRGLAPGPAGLAWPGSARLGSAAAQRSVDDFAAGRLPHQQRLIRAGLRSPAVSRRAATLAHFN